jgi:hypothetical protein
VSSSKIVRNLAIRQAHDQGASIADLAGQFSVGQRQIRNILAAPHPAEYAINNGNGNGNKNTPKQALGELGVSGLDYRSGWIQEEFLAELNSLSKRYKVYNEMRRNSTVLGVGLDMFALALRQATWSWEGDTDGDDRTEFLEGCWHDMSHSPDAFLSEIATMFTFGFSLFELVYKRRQGMDTREAPSQFTDGKIGWRKMAFRSQDSVNEWRFDDNGGLLGFVQLAPPTYRQIPIAIEKLLLFRTTTERGNPEGASLLRRAYPAYYYATHLQEIEAIGAERDLAGLPIIGADPAFAQNGVHPDFADGSTDLANAQQIVRRVRQDEQAGLVIPAGWRFELLSSSGGKQFNTDVLIQRYLRLQALALYSQFLMLGMDQVGSFALSSTHADIFSMAAGAFADSIADTINRHAVPRLLRLNGMDMQEPPRLAHGPLGKPDIAVLTQAIAAMSNAGVINVTDDKEGTFENYVRELIDAPPVTEEELKRREEGGNSPLKSEQIFGYHIESGAVSRNEVRASLGLPPVDDAEEKARRDLLAKIGVVKAAADTGVDEVIAEAMKQSGIKQEPKKPIPAALQRFRERIGGGGGDNNERADQQPANDQQPPPPPPAQRGQQPQQRFALNDEEPPPVPKLKWNKERVAESDMPDPYITVEEWEQAIDDARKAVKRGK